MKRKQIAFVGLWLCLTLLPAQTRPIQAKEVVVSPAPGFDLDVYPPPCPIRIDPAMPTIEDTLKVTVSGVWGRSCVPEYSSHQLTDREIQIDFTDVYADDNCLWVLTHWEHSIEVGLLPGGVYTATARIDKDICGSESFFVSPETQRVYLPMIVH